MKKILITGAGSYIGTRFEKYITENFAADYVVDTVDMLGDKWREFDFAGYDSVFHVAGIAHRKETKENAHLYFEINRDLAFEVANKAKRCGVKQFVFLSSMSVYGLDVGVIDKNTLPAPKSNYGKSKLQAEELIEKLRSDDFKVCILRPPMVYGEGCKGNYQTIVKIVKALPVFPRIQNQRSLIKVENLISFVKMAMDSGLDGRYFPQNREYVKTVDLAKDISKSLGKNIYLSVLLGLAVRLFRPFSKKLQKAFGDLVYKDTEDFDFCYCKKE